VNVRLTPVDAGAIHDFVAFFDDYRRELDRYSVDGPDTLPIGRYAEALERDPEGQELLWIEAGRVRAGFLLLRAFEDWPEMSGTVLDIAECYVVPSHRRRGIARAAIELLLARERERGTALVEASVLPENQDALAFWNALGFTARSVRTARKP